MSNTFSKERLEAKLDEYKALLNLYQAKAKSASLEGKGRMEEALSEIEAKVTKAEETLKATTADKLSEAEAHLTDMWDKLEAKVNEFKNS